jgi:CRISPR/Cas system Type II protein with McrA/HNH and RuvC-like nuclease domain
MPKATPAYVKNIIRRSFQEIIDPSPKKEDKERIWKFFNNKCAYCGKTLSKLQKEGHIEHVLPTSLSGPNQIRNLVLSCADCNEEKLDGSWHEFILKKNQDLNIMRERLAKIQEWQKLNEELSLSKDKIDKIEKLADLVAMHYDMKVKEAKNLRDS